MNDSGHRLTIAGQHVATLTWSDESDFPWARGPLEPAAGWPLLEPFLITTAHGSRRLDDNALAAEHPPHTWRLESGSDEEPFYLHTLVLNTDTAAAWRCGLDPLDADDE